LQSHNSVLDVGCNTGWFTRCAEAIAERVVGLGIDPDSLNFARSHSAGRAV
jgi:ribosomal protein L11 methylase PrmA